jgi:hypothetical protein
LLEPGPNIAPGLHVELNTRDARTTFHLYESIPLEIRISSSSPRKYSIELDRGWNAVAGDVDFLVSPGDAAISPLATSVAGYACCSSRRVFLTKTPEVFRYYLTTRVRFLRAGEYQVQYRTREVFRGAGLKKDQYNDRGDVRAISNVIMFTILPDDPEWNAATLKQALAILDDTNASRVLERDRRRAERAFGPQPPERRTTRLAPPEAMRYYDARHALQVLDTEEAIRERVRRIQMPTVSDWRESGEHGYTGVDDSLVKMTTRPDLVVTALEHRAARSDFGVQRGYVDLWVQALMQRDVPELSYLIPEESPRSVQSAMARAAENARKQVLGYLRNVASAKAGIASEMTTQTIRMLERDK